MQSLLCSMVSHYWSEFHHYRRKCWACFMESAQIIPTGVNKTSVIWRRIITNFYFSSAALWVHHQRASSRFVQEWLCVHLKFPTGYDAFRLLMASEFFLPASRCPWTRLGPQWLAWSVTTSVSKIKVWKNLLFKGMIRISCLHTT